MCRTPLSDTLYKSKHVWYGNITKDRGCFWLISNTKTTVFQNTRIFSFFFLRNNTKKTLKYTKTGKSSNPKPHFYRANVNNK